MKLKHHLYCLFLFVFSMNVLSAESFTVWDTFPMKDGSFIIVVDDPAKTVLKDSESQPYSYQIGDALDIDDLYNASSNKIVIENKNCGEKKQVRRLGGLWKKRDGSPLFQITRIIDWGSSLIVVSESEKAIDRWDAKIYVDQYVFKGDFHVGDNVYIIHSISSEWPNYREMLKFGGSGKVKWDNRQDCLINREEGVSSQWFYSWDPY